MGGRARHSRCSGCDFIVDCIGDCIVDFVGTSLSHGLQDAGETLSKAIVVAEKESQWAEVLRQEQVKVRLACLSHETTNNRRCERSRPRVSMNGAW